MTVDAVIGNVDLAADKPTPERRVAGIEYRLPVFVPGQQIGVFLEAVRKILQAEAFVHIRVGHVRLGDETYRRGVITLFLPMDGYFRLGNL
jgi:hypothetical protein